MKLGTETGSLTNHLYATSKQPTPEIGMGATILCWTDRHAGTIVKITPTQVHVQRDSATRTDKNGLSESQQYSYAPNPTGEIVVFRRRKNGSYRAATTGNGLLIGTRDEYYDYSF